MIQLIHLAYGIGCGILSAGIAICSKLMTPSIPALLKVFLRFFIGGACLIPFLSRAEFNKVTRRQILLFGAMGLTLVVMFNFLFFSALKYIDPMTSSLILSAQPIATLTASALLFGHLPTKRVLIGFMIAFSGVALVITKGQMSWDVLSGSIGEFLMLCAVVSQVAYTLILRNMGTHFSAQFITFSVSICGLLFLLPVTANGANITILTELTATDWLCISYIGIIGTSIGAVLFSLAIKHLGPALGSLVVFSTLPITTMAYSCIVGETPSTIEFVGSLLVLMGLVLGVDRRKKLPSATLIE
jgi:drug/metabolite transporter (DMT)-like permease